MKKDKPADRKPPQRTCVTCRTVGGKRGLIRLVRRPDGSVEVDETGRLAGRGAYLCRKEECWRQAASRIEYSLKIRLSPADRERLAARGRELLENE
jgi:predicted RNA-binding protein YlxR (DUF448 family)